MEFTAINGQLYVAVYLTEVCIVAWCTINLIIILFSIEIICSASTSEDSVFAIEFATVDGHRSYGFSCFSVYVSTHFTWDSSMWPKV